MMTVLLTLLLQAPPPAGQTVELPVSLDRLREGLARPGRFELPPPRPPRRPLFRIRIEQPMLLTGEAWEDRSVTPPWVRPSAPTVHFDFVSSVTPEEVRSSTIHPCCNVMPVVDAVSGLIGKGIRAAKERRAKGEVERAMRAAGIKR
jgi:hypothetical protein